MLRRLPPVLLLSLAVPIAVSARAPGDGLDGTLLAQLSYRERIVIRIPRLPVARGPAAEVLDWEEKKAPKCVPVAVLASASISPSGDVDLIATDGRRLRAKLGDNCPTLNFYTGFYLKRSPDGMVCARRDALRSRSGAHCQISRFRTLVEKK